MKQKIVLNNQKGAVLHFSLNVQRLDKMTRDSAAVDTTHGCGVYCECDKDTVHNPGSSGRGARP